MCLVCKQGYHGDFCNSQCPTSCAGECNKVNGQCDSELCVEGSCTNSTSKNISVGAPETPIAAIVAPVTVAVVLAFGISVVIVIVRRRRRFDDLAHNQVRQHLYDEIDENNLEPLNGRRNLEQRDPRHHDQVHRVSVNLELSVEANAMPPLQLQHLNPEAELRAPGSHMAERTRRHNDDLAGSAIQEHLHGDVNGDDYLVPINDSRNLQQRAPEHLDHVPRASVNRKSGFLDTPEPLQQLNSRAVQTSPTPESEIYVKSSRGRRSKSVKRSKTF